ncbi:hypothetical protein, partial [Psychrobacter pygoscelis]|uniref:hypothetical protein n=1 Tax=Psychrobacter pygoscelis TaxID=2488563 RepID=UPI00103E5F17
GTKVGDTLTVNGEVAPVTQAIIDDGVAIEIAPGTEVSASVTDAAGNPSPNATDRAPQADTIAPTAPVIGFESTGADDVYNSEEVGEDHTITATVTVPEGTKVGDTLTVNGEVAPVTQAIIDDGVAIEIAPGTEVSASVTDAAGNPSPNATDRAPQADTIAPMITTTLPIAGDNIVNSTEQKHVVIQGSTTGAEAGQTVTVVVTDVNDSTVTATGIVAVDGRWTVENVDLSDLDEGVLTVESSIQDLAGNSASDLDTVLKDTQIGAVVIADTLFMPRFPFKDGGIKVIPTNESDLSSMQISYVDETGSPDAEHKLLINYDSSTSQWQFASPSTVQSGISLDTNTGIVIFDYNRVLDGSKVTVSLQDTSGNSRETSHDILNDRIRAGQYDENSEVDDSVYDKEGPTRSVLFNETKLYVFKESGRTESEDGYYKVITKNGAATVVLTTDGANSKVNDYEDGPIEHDYVLLALDSEKLRLAKVLYERTLKFTEDDINEVTAESVIANEVIENDQYQALFNIVLKQAEDARGFKYLDFDYDHTAPTAAIRDENNQPSADDVDVSGLIFRDSDGKDIGADKLSQRGGQLVIDKSINEFSILYKVLNDGRTEEAETVTIVVDGDEYVSTIKAPDQVNTITLHDSSAPNYLDLGEEDDVLIIAEGYGRDTVGVFFSGGEGFDTVVLAGAGQTLTLNDEVNRPEVRGFESYDLTGAGLDAANTLIIADKDTFTVNALLDTDGANKLFVTGDSNDTVEWYGNSTSTITANYQGVSYAIYTDTDNNQLWVDEGSSITVI